MSLGAHLSSRPMSFMPMYGDAKPPAALRNASQRPRPAHSHPVTPSETPPTPPMTTTTTTTSSPPPSESDDEGLCSRSPSGSLYAGLLAGSSVVPLTTPPLLAATPTLVGRTATLPALAPPPPSQRRISSPHVQTETLDLSPSSRVQTPSISG